jgi:hypothetical protein
MFTPSLRVRSGKGINDGANHAIRTNLRRGGGSGFDERKRTALGRSSRTIA